MRRLLAFSFAAATALGGAALPCVPAEAADLDFGFDNGPPPPPVETKVEFGSGWYIRGDIGAVRLPHVQLGSPNNPSSQADPFVTDAPTATLNSGSKLGYDASLAAGYQWNRWIRTDLMADFHEPLTSTGSSGNGAVFCPTGVAYQNVTTSTTLAGTTTTTSSADEPIYANGGCTGNYRATVRSYDVLVNAYIDLGTWYRVTPYVGAGVGLSFGHYQTSSTYIQANGNPYQVSFSDPKFGQTYYYNYDRSSSGTYYNFAWALMGGIAIDVYSHTKLDIGYRYLNLGRIPGMSGNLTFNEVRAGLRYMIDN